jgi:hypothetical protein
MKCPGMRVAGSNPAGGLNFNLIKAHFHSGKFSAERKIGKCD